MPLRAVSISNVKATGKRRRLFDGGGLYLEVSATGRTWWRLKYHYERKEKVHGTADPVVPCDHAVRLHKALARKGVTEQLESIEGGSHGRFSLAQNQAAMLTIKTFLEDAGVLPKAARD